MFVRVALAGNIVCFRANADMHRRKFFMSLQKGETPRSCSRESTFAKILPLYLDCTPRLLGVLGVRLEPCNWANRAPILDRTGPWPFEAPYQTS